MKYSTVFFICCTVGLVACQDRSRKIPAADFPVTTLCWEADSLKKISDRITDIEVIPLENIPEAAFATVDQVVCRDHRYYIFDRYGSNKLLAFDDKGNFIRSFGRKGQGPGEYLALQNISFKEDTLYLHDRLGAKLLVYDTTGVCVDDIRINTQEVSQVTWLSDGFLLYHSLYQDESFDNTREAWKIDTKGNYRDIYFMHHRYSSRANYAAPIAESDSTMLLSRYFNDTVLVFNRQGNIREALLWDFGVSAIPQQLRPEVRTVLDRQKDFAYLASTVVPAGPFLIGTVSDHGQRGVFLYDSRNGRIYADMTGETIPALPSNLAAKDSTAIVSWLSYGVKDNFIPSLGKERVTELLPALENGQTFLVVYHLKKNAV